MVEVLKGKTGDDDCVYGSQEKVDVIVRCDGCGKDMVEDELLYEYNEGFYCAECLKEEVPRVTANELLEMEMRKCL